MFKKLLIALALCFCCFGTAPARELEDALLALYADPDPKISAGAVLLTIDALERDRLLDCLKRRVRAPHSPLFAKVVYSFGIARWERDNRERQQAFIRIFPQTPEDMLALLEFEDSVRAAVYSMVVDYLFTLAHSPDAATRQAARKKIARAAKAYAACWAREQFDEKLREMQPE